jgi:surface carbohydrate biosynthesis protein
MRINTVNLIYFPIETISREFDAKLLLSAGALSRGYSVLIGKRPKVMRVALNTCQGLYMYKDHTGISDNLIYEPLSRCGIQSVALDEEGLVYRNPEIYIKNRVQVGTAFDHIRSVFCWGKEQYDILATNFNEIQNKVLITGNPRFDLLRKPFELICSDQADFLKNKYGSFVLINTNFASFNRAKFYKASVVDNLRRNGILISEDEEAIYNNRILYQKKLYEKYVELVFSMSILLKDIRIIVRPHPSEEITMWQRDLAGLPNVSVIQQGNVHEWILASKAVIHTGCTTGIEAFLAEKPVLRYHPVYDAEFEPYLPNCFGESFTDTQSLISRVREICCSDVQIKRDENQMELLQKHIANITGPFAYEKILDEIDKIASEYSGDRVIKDVKISVGPKEYLKRKLNHFSCRFEKKLSLVIGKKMTKKLTGRTQKFPGISAKIVEEKLNRLFEVAPKLKNPGFTVKEIEGDVIMICPHVKVHH